MLLWFYWARYWETLGYLEFSLVHFHLVGHRRASRHFFTYHLLFILKYYFLTFRNVGKTHSRRFSKKANHVLKEWLRSHYHDFKPSKEEKIELSFKTDLSLNQINYWVWNTRRNLKDPKYVQDVIQLETVSNVSSR